MTTFIDFLLEGNDDLQISLMQNILMASFKMQTATRSTIGYTIGFTRDEKKLVANRNFYGSTLSLRHFNFTCLLCGAQVQTRDEMVEHLFSSHRDLLNPLNETIEEYNAGD